MAFNGWLIKLEDSPDLDKLFPHKYIEKSTYKCTPSQRTVIKEYFDNNNNRHKVVSPNCKTKIEFSTYKLNLAQLSEIQSKLRAAMVNNLQRKIRLTFWNDETLSYETGWFSLGDRTYEIISIDPKKNDIKYEAISFEFEQY